MGRAIKFRTWLSRKNRYLDLNRPEVMLSQYEPDNEQGMDVYGSGGYTHPDAILEQFTGFTDKNGIEIYEGDIIERAPYNHLFGKTSIIFEHGCFVESKFKYTLGFIAGPGFEDGVLKNFEVVGNIHENPDLLK